MKKELKKLKKIVDKNYWKKKQFTYVAPHCIFNRQNDWHVDIMLTDEEGKEWGTFLFSIRTLDCLLYDGLDYIGGFKSYLTEQKFINVSNLNEAAYTPFYMDQTFTLKKFGNITEEDIYKCTDYFIHKVLDLFLFNIRVKVQYEKKRKKKK